MKNLLTTIIVVTMSLVSVFCQSSTTVYGGEDKITLNISRNAEDALMGNFSIEKVSDVGFNLSRNGEPIAGISSSATIFNDTLGKTIIFLQEDSICYYIKGDGILKCDFREGHAKVFEYSEGWNESDYYNSRKKWSTLFPETNKSTCGDFREEETLEEYKFLLGMDRKDRIHIRAYEFSFKGAESGSLLMKKFGSKCNSSIWEKE